MKQISLLITILSFSSVSAQNTNFEKIGSFFSKTVSIAKSEDEMYKRLGEPDSIRIDTVINKYDRTSIDTLIHYFYDGIQISYYCVQK